MRIGGTRNLIIDGVETPAHYIGQGMFCKAYRSGNRVYLLCHGDYSKECISLFCDKSVKHIPDIKRHSDIDGDKNFQVFSMPFYHKLTKRDYPKAYKQWKTLPSIIRSYSEASSYIDSEQNNTPESVREAIRELIEAFCNHDIDGMLLEFNRANVGVNDKGELILRDCLANRTSIERARTERKKRGRYE
jgi:hypothetical protein